MTTTSAGLYGQPQRATAARLADGAAFPPIPSGRRIRSITIIFDEGQDNPTASELGSGLAVLDNIDVNGNLVGRSPQRNGNNEDGNHGDHDDGDNEHGDNEH